MQPQPFTHFQATTAELAAQRLCHNAPDIRYPLADTSFMPRKLAEKLCPALEQLATALDNHCDRTENYGHATCLLVDTCAFPQLLPTANHHDIALVMFFPLLGEPCIDQAVVQQPTCLNILSEDRMHNITYHCWGFESVLGAMQVWVPDDELCPLLDSHHGKADAVKAAQGDQWIPVIMVASDTVAVGGFALTEDYLTLAQTARRESDKNWDPYERFSMERLLEYERQMRDQDPLPWYREWHDLCSDLSVIEPLVLDFRGWPDETT